MVMPISDGTYRFRSRLIRGLPAIERYRRFGLFPAHYSSLRGGISLAAAREKEEEVEEEAEEKGEPEDLVLLSLDDLDPSSPSLTGRRRCAPFFSSSPHTR
ncbi:hypothetical protein BHE74_00043890, partial [Ensete ventricosum]